MASKIYYCYVIIDSDFDNRILLGFGQTLEAAKKIYKNYVNEHKGGIFAPLYGACENTFLFR